MSFLFKLAKDFLSLLLVLFVFSLSTYVTDDELQNVKITPGDQIIIDLIKKLKKIIKHKKKLSHFLMIVKKKLHNWFLKEKDC